MINGLASIAITLLPRSRWTRAALKKTRLTCICGSWSDLRTVEVL
jgi:hypothetical protein